MSICEQDQYNSTYGLFDLTIYKILTHGLFQNFSR